MGRGKKGHNKSTSANLGFEATLWAAADKMRAAPVVALKFGGWLYIMKTLLIEHLNK
jgi:hypothetical protein